MSAPTLVGTDWSSLQSALDTISQGGFAGTLEIGTPGNPADIKLQGDLPLLNGGIVTPYYDGCGRLRTAKLRP